MSWLRIDDKFPSHRKVLALGAKGRKWTWLELLAYCASHKSDVVPEGIAAVVPAATKRYLADCVSIGLLDVSDGVLRVHDWETYNPKDPTKAERQARWRRRSRDGDVDAPVDGDVDASRAGATRVPVPSRTQPPKQDLDPGVGSKRNGPKPGHVWQEGDEPPDLTHILREIA